MTLLDNGSREETTVDPEKIHADTKGDYTKGKPIWYRRLRRASLVEKTTSRAKPLIIP